MSALKEVSLFFLPYAFMSPHSDVTLAYIQQEIAKGNSVLVLMCGGGFTCGFNLYGMKSKCNYCVRRSREFIPLFEGRVEWKDINSLNMDVHEAVIDSIRRTILSASTLDQVKDIFYKGSDLGYAIVSALVSRFRTAKIDAKKKKILIQLADSFIRAYEAVRYLGGEYLIREAYVFNGRLEFTRGFFRGCECDGVDCNILEVSQVGAGTLSYKNALPLDIEYTKTLINALWNRAGKEELKKAEDFYRLKAQGVAIHDKVYTSEQKRELLPSNWDEGKRNIVIFGSSADEFYSIGKDWEFPFYSSQGDGIKQIASSLAAEDGIDVYYRMHPNLSLLQDDELKECRVLAENYRNFHVIKPHERVSSYALMKVADVIVTFGSSVGIEALYWGKRSVLVGMSMYAHLEGVERPLDHNQLLSFLRQEAEPEADNVGALKYSNFLMARGLYTPGLTVSSGCVKFHSRREDSDFKVERMLFKLSCLFESLRDWNTFALAIRDRVPGAVKRLICNTIQQ